jgi:hypothetical protein
MNLKVWIKPTLICISVSKTENTKGPFTGDGSQFIS